MSKKVKTEKWKYWLIEDGLLDVDGEYGRKNDVPPVDEWVAGKDYSGD